MITAKVTGIQQARKDIANSVYQVARAAIVKADQLIQVGQPRTSTGHPVWTGYARANWHASVGTPASKLSAKPLATSFFVQIVTNQINSIKRSSGDAADVTLPKTNMNYDTVYLTNIVDYIEELEQGLNKYPSPNFVLTAVKKAADSINTSNKRY